MHAAYVYNIRSYVATLSNKINALAKDSTIAVIVIMLHFGRTVGLLSLQIHARSESSILIKGGGYCAGVLVGPGYVPRENF